MFEAILYAMATAAAGFGAVPFAIRLLAGSRVMDVPNARSSHTQPTPRGGGIGILLPWMVGMAVGIWTGDVPGTGFPAALMVGVGGMAIIGFIDDVRSLPALPRLIAEGALVALCLGVSGASVTELALPGIGAVDLGPLGPVVAWLFVVGFTNMFNFMDGINGIAGFQTLIGAAGLAFLGASSGDPSVLVPMALLSGSAVGFLFFNFPRASVFMGDVGSLPIGFALAMGVLRVHGGGGEGGLPLWIPVLTIWPFLFDATYTLINRTLRKRNPFRAHRSHAYQRLVVSGWSHVRVTMLYALAMLICSACSYAYGVERISGPAVFLGVVLVSLGWMIVVVSRIRASVTEREGS